MFFFLYFSECLPLGQKLCHLVKCLKKLVNAIRARTTLMKTFLVKKFFIWINFTAYGFDLICVIDQLLAGVSTPDSKK